MITLIIPVRDWPDRRIELCVESFERLSARALSEILVVDFGSKTPVRLPRRRRKPGIAVRKVTVEAKLWSLAEAINVGVAAAANDIVAKTDADILVSPDSRAAFDAVAERLAAGALGLSMTQATDLDASIDPETAAASVAAGETTIGRLRPRWGQGGLVMFSRRTWDAVGGFDSRFTGWGNEDNDFAERVRRSGHRIEWTDRDALKIFHIWHAPTMAAAGVMKQRLRNLKLAKDDKSVFRPIAFRHSNFAKIAAPEVMKRISPLISVAIATSTRPNRDRMLAEAIGSFKGQMENDVEFVVLDNGSPPEASAALKKRLGRMGIGNRLVFETEQQGLIPGARNIISRIARGRFICVADDDDFALPDRLLDHLKPFESDGTVHGTHGGWIDFDEESGIIERNSGKQRSIITLLKGFGRVSLHPACFYRTDVMRAIPYDEGFTLGSDFDLALRMANMGFEIAHTGTYVTLRRFHAANVTITGQSNQATNGGLARNRTLASFGWSRHKAIEEAAKKLDKPVYCENQMSIDTIAALMPSYAGTWQVYVPIAALSPVANGRVVETGAAMIGQLRPIAPSHTSELIASSQHVSLVPEIDDDMAPAEAPPLESVNAQTLSALLDIVDGEIVTRHSGLNQPVFFRSAPIARLGKARQLREKIEALVKARVTLDSVRQGQLEREAPFDWRGLPVKGGERMLKSARFANLADALIVFSRIGPSMALRRAVSVLADFDEEGEAYYLITPAVRGFDQLRALQFELERHTQIDFRQHAFNGVPSELPYAERAS